MLETNSVAPCESLTIEKPMEKQFVSATASKDPGYILTGIRILCGDPEVGSDMRGFFPSVFLVFTFRHFFLLFTVGNRDPLVDLHCSITDCYPFLLPVSIHLLSLRN